MKLNAYAIVYVQRLTNLITQVGLAVAALHSTRDPALEQALVAFAEL